MYDENELVAVLTGVASRSTGQIPSWLHNMGLRQTRTLLRSTARPALPKPDTLGRPDHSVANDRLVNDTRASHIERLHTRIGELADDRRDGALLLIEALPSSLARIKSRLPEQKVAEILLAAADRAARRFAAFPSARTSWNRYEIALEGAQVELVHDATALINELLADVDCCDLDWRAVLIQIFPGDASRTLACDPGYDLAALETSAVVWVQPYSGPDWELPQRYPTTHVLWQRLG